MSREKQIEEMWNIITTDCNRECVGCEFENDEWCFTHSVVNKLYNAGYRKQEWISVEDRLPEEEVPVIVYKRNNDIFGNMESAYLYKGKWVGTIGEYVTHWMPLPEAPKMKGGAE